VKQGKVKTQLKVVMSKFVKPGKHSFMMKAKRNNKKQMARKSSTACKGKAEEGDSNMGKEQKDEGMCTEEEGKGKGEE
jgi:hypothetical protein